MIGYGIPRTVERIYAYDGKGRLSRFGVGEKIFYEWEEGYLCETTGGIDEWLNTDEFQFLRWNDFYLNFRAKTIQRWFRSFEELPMACPCDEKVVYNPKNRRKEKQ